MKATDIAWAAGFIDGEGSIMIGRSWPTENNGVKTVKHHLRIQLANTHRPSLDMLQSLFGGAINLYRGRKSETWMWTLTGSFLDKALPMLYLYFKAKREQARLGIEFLSLYHRTHPAVRRQGMSIEDIAQRDAYYWALRRAKVLNTGTPIEVR